MPYFLLSYFPFPSTLHFLFLTPFHFHTFFFHQTLPFFTLSFPSTFLSFDHSFSFLSLFSTILSFLSFSLSFFSLVLISLFAILYISPYLFFSYQTEATGLALIAITRCLTPSMEMTIQLQIGGVKRRAGIGAEGQDRKGRKGKEKGEEE